MSISNIGIGFSVKKFPININFDVRINCREEFNFLRYSSKFGGNNVGVAFLNSKPITVSENIIVQDLTEMIPENSPRKFFERVETSQTFTIESGDFFITDVIKLTSTGEEVPLYLRHNLSSFSNVSNVEILDSNFNPVSADLYAYYDESATLGHNSKYIYTNIENSYDSVRNEYTLYYYRFKDTTTGRLVIGLLDSKSFYREAEFTTPQTERAYRIDSGNEFSSVKVWFNSRIYSPTANPTQQRFAIKAGGSDRISLLPPIDISASQRWYPRITRSQFYRNVAPGQRKFYYVPEYFNQFFSPVPPYKSLIENQAKILDDKLIYVAPSPMANLGVTGFYVYIVLKDGTGRSVRAFTNDPAASVYINKNKVITDIYYEKDMIQSIDSAHGFIRLANSIDTSLTAYVTYRYEEPHLTYRDINVNSTINPDVLNTSMLFYIIPEGSTPNTRSVFHLQIDEANRVIAAPQDESFIGMDLNDWIAEHTSDPHHYVLIGKMFSVQTLAPRDIDSVDIRIRGGGVKEKQLEAALGLQDEVQWYWDIGYWDGQPYPGMGAIVVEIPRRVLVEVGGTFTRNQIEDIVRRHMAEGGYPIIRYYDRSTLITKVEPGDKHVLLKWQDVEAGFYNVYYGTTPDTMHLFRSVSGAVLEMLVDGLENDKPYYFKVESVIGGYAQLPSKTVIAIPYNTSTVLPPAVYGETVYMEGTYSDG